MKRCKAETGIAGFEIGTTINESNLDDPKYDAIWKVAEVSIFTFAISILKIIIGIRHVFFHPSMGYATRGLSGSVLVSLVNRYAATIRSRRALYHSRRGT